MSKAIDIALKYVKNTEDVILVAPCDVNPAIMNQSVLSKGYDMTSPLLKQLEAGYEVLAKKKKISFLSLYNVVSKKNYTDGVHPNAVGDDEIAKALLNDLKPRLESNTTSSTIKTGDVISIWPEGTKGVRVGIAEKTKSKNDRYYNIFNPTIEVVKPMKPNGAAIVICPGGGYSYVGVGVEGRDIATHFADAGVTCFVLKYRLPKTQNAKFEHPVPLSDAQRAIKYVRYHAKQWGLDSKRIGVMGFSAGGHLASMAGTLFEHPVNTGKGVAEAGCRPDFVVLVYPVINSFTKGVAHQCTKKLISRGLLKTISSELNVTPETPQTYLIHALDDRVVNPQNSICMYDALKASGVDAELKLYNKGGHGFGEGRRGTDSRQWIKNCLVWLRSREIIPE